MALVGQQWFSIVACTGTLPASDKGGLRASARSTTVRLVERSKIFLHFIPTISSWLNMVERFFRTLTDRQIRRGVFTSVKELEARLAEYIDTYNENPQPFVWTKSAKQILEKVGRARQALGHQSA